MATKKENKKLCMEIIDSLYGLDNNINIKRNYPTTVIETEKYLLDIRNMVNKVKEFYR